MGWAGETRKVMSGVCGLLHEAWRCEDHWVSPIKEGGASMFTMMLSAPRLAG
ncbi:hypothetical protein SAMN05216284_120123 [Micromonospora sediminimaris]|nr:hypothetical protein SAMN05216284_120123 [Micromonospora sediminimaris]